MFAPPVCIWVRVFPAPRNWGPEIPHDPGRGGYRKHQKTTTLNLAIPCHTLPYVAIPGQSPAGGTERACSAALGSGAGDDVTKRHGLQYMQYHMETNPSTGEFWESTHKFGCFIFWIQLCSAQLTWWERWHQLSGRMMLGMPLLKSENVRLHQKNLQIRLERKRHLEWNPLFGRGDG